MMYSILYLFLYKNCLIIRISELTKKPTVDYFETVWRKQNDIFEKDLRVFRCDAEHS